MKDLVGNYKSCRPVKSGALLVEVECFDDVKNILVTKNFMEIEVEAKLAIDVESKKGIIHVCRIIMRTEDELCEIWKRYGVIHVEKHTSKDSDGTIAFNGTFTLTFNDKLPEKIYVGDQVKWLRPWLRTVLQCTRFNHFAKES